MSQMTTLESFFYQVIEFWCQRLNFSPILLNENPANKVKFVHIVDQGIFIVAAFFIDLTTPEKGIRIGFQRAGMYSSPDPLQPENWPQAEDFNSQSVFFYREIKGFVASMMADVRAALDASKDPAPF